MNKYSNSLLLNYIYNINRFLKLVTLNKPCNMITFKKYIGKLT